MKEDSILVKDLSFSYRLYGNGDSFKDVLHAISCSVDPGNSLLVLGMPDSGKTTLSRILAGLIPKYGDGRISGSLVVDGVDVRSCQPWDLVEHCAWIGQNPQEQLLMTTCADELAFPLESLGWNVDRIVRRVEHALEAWGLAGFAAVNPQEMSGGERKRLLLAVLDIVPAPVWILDEPFDDLDAYWRMKLMERIGSHHGPVLVLASRYLDEFRGSFDQYALLSGKTIAEGEEQDVVVAYDELCEEAFPSVCVVNRERGQITLSCEDLEIEHARKSVASHELFSVSVDSFSLAAGEIVSLTGPNGSGKTTVARILCGLDAPRSGICTLGGVPASQRDLNRSVGYVFQNPDYEIFMPTVRAELSWSLSGIGASDRESMVLECCELFHLNPDETPATMGYGARKHLQAAVHWLLDRPFYILDELDSGITYSAAFEMVCLLGSRGAGIVLISHDKSFSERLAQRRYLIGNGRMVLAKDSL